jgi:hypothetical protein
MTTRMEIMMTRRVLIRDNQMNNCYFICLSRVSVWTVIVQVSDEFLITNASHTRRNRNIFFLCIFDGIDTRSEIMSYPVLVQISYSQTVSATSTAKCNGQGLQLCFVFTNVFVTIEGKNLPILGTFGNSSHLTLLFLAIGGGYA